MFEIALYNILKRVDGVTDTEAREVADEVATKADFKDMLTKADIKDMATKADFKDMLTKADIKDMATKMDMVKVESAIKEVRIELKYLRWSFFFGFSILLAAIKFL